MHTHAHKCSKLTFHHYSQTKFFFQNLSIVVSSIIKTLEYLGNNI